MYARRGALRGCSRGPAPRVNAGKARQTRTLLYTPLDCVIVYRHQAKPVPRETLWRLEAQRGAFRGAGHFPALVRVWSHGGVMHLQTIDELHTSDLCAVSQ